MMRLFGKLSQGIVVEVESMDFLSLKSSIKGNESTGYSSGSIIVKCKKIKARKFICKCCIL